jgi:hypothetical protein
MRFDELESRYAELKEKHVAGLLSDDAFRARVAELRAEDAQGRVWTLEPRQGRWYVYQGGEWVRAEPPRSGPANGGLRRGLAIGCIAAVGLALLSCLALVVYGVVAPGRPLVRLFSGLTTETPMPEPVCTPPLCGSDEAYHCPGDCPGGCGVVCATFTPDAALDQGSGAGTPSATPTRRPVCTPPPCGPDEAYHCPGDCPGGCGVVCATFTPSPAPTGTPGPAGSSATATPTPVGSGLLTSTPCTRAPWGWFAGALMFTPGARDKIGCPVADAQTVTAASQDFERGMMIWREDERLIYVFYDGGGWEAYPEQWQDGMPEQDPAYGPPPEGLIQPKRGFGLVWQEHASVRDRLGWALNEERQCDEAHVQPFERGLMLSCTHSVVPGAKIYVFALFDDSTYDLYMP